MISLSNYGFYSILSWVISYVDDLFNFIKASYCDFNFPIKKYFLFIYYQIMIFLRIFVINFLNNFTIIEGKGGGGECILILEDGIKKF